MYSISGIPVLVLLNGPDASVITLNGRSIVTEDENGEDFPWLPLPVLDLLHEAPLIKCSDGKEVDPSVVDGKKIGLFFGAIWVSTKHSCTGRYVSPIYSVLTAKISWCN